MQGETVSFFFVEPFQIEVTNPTAIDPSVFTKITTFPGLRYISCYRNSFSVVPNIYIQKLQQYKTTNFKVQCVSYLLRTCSNIFQAAASSLAGTTKQRSWPAALSPVIPIDHTCCFGCLDGLWASLPKPPEKSNGGCVDTNSWRQSSLAALKSTCCLLHHVHTS